MVFKQPLVSNLKPHCFHLDSSLKRSSNIRNWLSWIPTQSSLVNSELLFFITIQYTISTWLLRAQKGLQATPSLAIIGLILLLFVMLHPKHTGKKRKISVISKRVIEKARHITEENNKTVQGNIARNEIDTHADTCCSVTIWTPMNYTGDICEVYPFLSTYAPVQEIPVERCCTVWTDD